MSEEKYTSPSFYRIDKQQTQGTPVDPEALKKYKGVPLEPMNGWQCLYLTLRGFGKWSEILIRNIVTLVLIVMVLAFILLVVGIVRIPW